MESPNSTDSILILDPDPQSISVTSSSLSEQLPSAVIDSVSSLEELRNVLENKKFDIVVIDHSPLGPDPINLIHELQILENEPSVLVVSDSTDPRFIADVYNNGGQRCIVKDARWQSQLGRTIRQALRFRKLKDRNRELQARLVEANMLLEEKNKRLDDFSATVAHDIRGPLAGLSMKLEFILDTYENKLDKRCEQLLRTGLGSVERLSRIVQGMYEYAKLGSKATEMRTLNLVELVGEVVSDMHFDENREVRIGIGNLPEIWGNEELIRRAFINLFSNAVKYNDSKEAIINVSVGKESNNHLASFVDIIVSDNGRGIPQDEVQQIFGMFHRASSAGADTEGSGVGLAVVQRVAELHFGRVRAESEVGKGTKFIITLPLERVDFIK